MWLSHELVDHFGIGQRWKHCPSHLQTKWWDTQLRHTFVWRRKSVPIAMSRGLPLLKRSCCTLLAGRKVQSICTDKLPKRWTLPTVVPTARYPSTGSTAKADTSPCKAMFEVDKSPSEKVERGVEDAMSPLDVSPTRTPPPPSATPNPRDQSKFSRSGRDPFPECSPRCLSHEGGISQTLCE